MKEILIINKIPILISLVSLFILVITLQLQSKSPKDKLMTSSYDKNIDLNILIQKYNNIISSYKILVERAHNTATQNEDIPSLNQIGNLSEAFLKHCAICFDQIDILKAEQTPKRLYEETDCDLRLNLGKLESLLKQIELIEKSSAKYNYEIPQEDPPVYNQANHYFVGCKDIESLNKRYKVLAKAFHPDSGFGDKNSFQQMQAEYTKLKRTFLDDVTHSVAK